MARVKDRNRLKKMFLKPLQQYCERLEKENEALKGDPNTIIGQFLGQMREMYSANSKLSVLAAALIDRIIELEEAPVKAVTISRESMERFKGYRLVIKWELPEGVEKPDDAAEFKFTYEAVPESQPQQAEKPMDAAGCTDPNCTLPKDLIHSHDDHPCPYCGNPAPSRPCIHGCNPPCCGCVDSLTVAGTTSDEFTAAKDLKTGDTVILNGEPVKVIDTGTSNKACVIPADLSDPDAVTAAVDSVVDEVQPL